MSNFILELLSEEIPSRMQKQASEYLQREFKQKTEDAGLASGQIRSFYSMRRLTIIVTNMKSETTEMVIEKLGPRINSPDNAINGFLRSNNIKSIDTAKSYGSSEKNIGEYFTGNIYSSGLDSFLITFFGLL